MKWRASLLSVFFVFLGLLVGSFITNQNLRVSALTSSGSLSITENGTYDVTDYAEVVVDVPPTFGDYHDDIQAVKNSIFVCGGVMLVIYFFYCIYRMIFKGAS